jgi:hypothetical protein
MRKFVLSLGLISMVALVVVLTVPWESMAQWGAISSGVDAARRAGQAANKPAGGISTTPEGNVNVADEKTAGAGSTTSMTYQNKIRPFSYTIPAGWRKEGGDPTGEKVTFMIPGTSCGFTFHFTQMVPSFPRQASVDASLKSAKEEMSIGKYIAVKRRDQGGSSGVIGWETTESATKGSGGFQRIQWQCYDSQNYYYSFIAHTVPSQFNQYRSALQSIIDSIRFK